MYLFDKLSCLEARPSGSDKESLRTSVLNELSNLFARRHFFLSDDNLRGFVGELPYGPSPFPVDVKIGHFISPQLKSTIEAFVQRVVEENEPRLKRPRIEVTNSKSNMGCLKVVVSGFLEEESDPLELITVMYG